MIASRRHEAYPPHRASTPHPSVRHVMDAADILVRRGMLNERQLAEVRAAKATARAWSKSPCRWATARKKPMLKALATEVGLDYVDLAEATVDLSLLKDFPPKLMHRQALFPVRRENGSLVVATSDPFDLYPLDELSAATGLTVVPVLASRAEIAKLIKTHLGVGSETVTSLIAQADDDVELLGEIETDGSELSEMAQEASVVRLVNEILLEAIESRASDVHIEPQAHGLRIRYRIDGVLQPQPMPPEIIAVSGGDHQPPEDHGAAEHRRKAAAARRPHQAARAGPRDRRPRVGHPDDPRRRHRHAYPRQGPMEFKLQKLGMEEDLYQHVPRTDRSAARHRPGHRADRLRQDHDALQRADGNSQRRHEDHHHRRPGRISARRHQPDSGACEDRPDVRRTRCAAFCVTTPTSC